jgi:hypothetical protein
LLSICFGACQPDQGAEAMQMPAPLLNSKSEVNAPFTLLPPKVAEVGDIFAQCFLRDSNNQND